MCSSEFNLQGTNMDYLPSKELLSEVLGHKIWKVMDCNMGTLRYCIYPNKGDEPSEYMFPINIHELAHKCKEWAKSQKLFILSFPSPNEGLEGYWANLTNNTHRAFAATEPEAIFQACQWILDNRN